MTEEKSVKDQVFKWEEYDLVCSFFRLRWNSYKLIGIKSIPMERNGY